MQGGNALPPTGGAQLPGYNNVQPTTPMMAGSATTNGSAPAPPMDLGPMLWKRLEEKKGERNVTQAKIQRVNVTLQKLLSNAAAKNRRRETLEQLDAHIRQLEQKRISTSLKLSEEKQVLRQIETLERMKKQETEIQQLKVELNALRDVLRETNNAVRELEGALGKVELADRIGVSANALSERIIDCPADKIARVIGKNGSMIAQIERKTGVRFEVEDDSNNDRNSPTRIRIVGSERTMNAAIEEVENITLAVDEDVNLAPSVATFLLAKKGALMVRARQTHPSVQFDLNKNVLRLRGRPESVSAAKLDILSIDVRTASLTIPSKQIGLILGKGGANITKLEVEHDVSINIETKDRSEESVIEVVGLSPGVEAAHSALADLIYENEDVEESILVQPEHRVLFLENQGAVLKDIQNQLFGCRLYFERSEDGDSSLFNHMPSNLTVRTRRSNIADAVRLVQDKIATFLASMISISVDSHVIPSIIGKGGATIKALQSEGNGASISVDKDTCTVTIQTEDEATREAVKQKVEEIIASNQILMVPIERGSIGILYGDPGKDMRNQLTEQIGANMSLTTDDENVIIRGTNEQIQAGAELIKQFLLDNFMTEISVSQDDEQFLFQGGQDSFLSTVEKKHSVSTTLVRSKHLVSIRGKEENVDAARQELLVALYGGNGRVVLKVPVPSTSRGIIVGKEGSQLKKLESDYEGVSATLLRSSDVLVIRGPEEPAKKCRTRVYVVLATTPKVERISLTEEQQENLDKTSLSKEISDMFGIQLNIDPGYIRLRGAPVDIRDAKIRVIELITGQYSSSYPLEEGQLAIIKKAAESTNEIGRICDISKSSVSLVEKGEGCILMEGKRPQVKKAKFALLKFLDSCLPGQFSKVTVPKTSWRSLANAVSLAMISSETGAHLWLDRDLSSVIVRSSDSDQVAAGVVAIKGKLENKDSKASVLKLDAQDSWMLPKIIGKGGASIQEVRKESGCSIHVATNSPTITLLGDDASISKARSLLETIIEQCRKECVFVDLPEGCVTEFVGKAGTNVKAVEKQYGVTIERFQGHRSKILIQGGEEAVQTTAKAIETWVADWKAKNGVTTMTVPSNAAAVIVGKKGAMINSLETETGCSITVDRDGGLVTLCGSDVSRATAQSRISRIVQEEQSRMETIITPSVPTPPPAPIAAPTTVSAPGTASAPVPALAPVGPPSSARAAPQSNGSSNGINNVPSKSFMSEGHAVKMPNASPVVMMNTNGSVNGSNGTNGTSYDSGRKSPVPSQKQAGFISLSSYKPNPLATSAGKDLLKFLNGGEIDSEMEKTMRDLGLNVPTGEADPQHSLSNGASANKVSNGASEVPEGYFKSESGFIVRI